MEQTLFVDRFSLKTCLRKMSTIIFSAYGIKKTAGWRFKISKLYSY